MKQDLKKKKHFPLLHCFFVSIACISYYVQDVDDYGSLK